jgi:D-3-phosphoglycerate dehydrogenase / 2-oxoglutarate reductase
VNILVADDIAVLGIQKLKELPDAVVDIRTGLSEPELVEIMGRYDALLVRSQTKVTAPVIDAGTRLKVIGRAGVGVDNIDVPAATRRGVLVVNAPDGNTISAAEHTFAMMISLARHIPQAQQATKQGVWDRKSFLGVELRGKTLAVIGLGRIGTEVAKRALGFEMEVVGYDPYLTVERATELGITKASLEDAIVRGDFITVHTPLTKETRHLIDKNALEKMKPGVRIVNCARGGIIDEYALADALIRGHVAGAAIDVFEEEPVPADHPLLPLQNVVVTPHLGASTVEAQVNVAIEVADEIGRILRGLPFHNAVNLPAMSVQQKEYLDPYLHLGEKLGIFLAQWCDEAISEIEMTYAGEISASAVSFITRTVLKGLFAYRYGDEANYVNAPLIAEQNGISVREIKQPRSKIFTNLISLKVTGERGGHTLVGTLYNGGGPRIVEIDGYRVDAPPEGKFLFTRHVDKPGMIGGIGTLLGDLDINIATMQVGRREHGGAAIMLLGVDKVVPNQAIQRIRAMSGIDYACTLEI